jgi:formylglycine-generating enzyme required for sulfatase activity
MTGREAVYQIWSIPDWESYLTWAISTSSTSAATNIYAVEEANGFRLPTLDEWLWAAMGADLQNPGQVNTAGAKKYYSGGPAGSNTGMENFAWVISNSSIITHEVGKKAANELGIFDMTGNVSEWVYEVMSLGMTAVSHIGHSMRYAGGLPLYSSFSFDAPNVYHSEIGFRIVRNQ